MIRVSLRADPPGPENPTSAPVSFSDLVLVERLEHGVLEELRELHLVQIAVARDERRDDPVPRLVEKRLHELRGIDARETSSPRRWSSARVSRRARAHRSAFSRAASGFPRLSACSEFAVYPQAHVKISLSPSSAKTTNSWFTSPPIVPGVGLDHRVLQPAPLEDPAVRTGHPRVGLLRATRTSRGSCTRPS